MKTRIVSIKSLMIIFGLLFAGLYAFAQQPALQYFRYNDKRGLNVYETSKEDTIGFDGIKVRVGGDFAIQYQGLSQENSAGNLRELTSNFNLPSANLNLDAQLLDGVRLHMRTYLSSRHHNEGWVKGGYLQIDNLNFIKEGFLGGFMDVATVRFGYNDINYGDLHFRRSDNGTVIYNAFVGNYIMDSFTTEPFGELTIQKNGIIGVVGATNGRLNQTTAKNLNAGTGAQTDGDNGMAFYLKLGYDKQFNEDLRFRITGSYYNSTDKGTRDYLYGGDRAGARYYEVYNTALAGNPAPSSNNNDFHPRWNPGYAYLSAIQFNPFLKYKGLEFFGVLEIVGDGNSDNGGSYTQTAGELLYRFGGKEQLFIGGRLNGVKGNQTEDAAESKINRQNYAFGWYMSDNIIIKLEYVTEKRTGDGWTGSIFEGAKFDGIMIEAGISF